jgi:hypothetical protein
MKMKIRKMEIYSPEYGQHNKENQGNKESKEGSDRDK